MRNRSCELEILDQGNYNLDEYHECLDQLSQIGRFLGGNSATLASLRNWAPRTILDVGCGGGGFTKKLALIFPESRVVGIDLSHPAIAYAQQKHRLDNLSFEVVEGLPFSDNSFDLVTSTLVCHHISDEGLIHFLNECYRISNQRVVLNDLHRHPIAVGAFYAASRLFFRNRLIKHDGIVSIKRGFKRKEWFNYLEKTTIPVNACSIRWHFPFRWIVEIRKWTM